MSAGRHLIAAKLGQQIASKIGVSIGTVNAAIMQMHNRPESRTNSRGEVRSTTYAKKISNELPKVPPAEPEEEEMRRYIKSCQLAPFAYSGTRSLRAVSHGPSRH